MCILHNNRQTFNTFLENTKPFTYKPIIRLYKHIYYNLIHDIKHNLIPLNKNPINKLSYIIYNTYLSYNIKDFWSYITTQRANTKILYAIFTTNRIYIGITNNALRRIKEHIYYTKKRRHITATLGKQKSFLFKGNISTKLYSFLTKKDRAFFFIPICRLKDNESDIVEKQMIASLGTNALNEEISKRKNLHSAKDIIMSTPTNFCKKRKRFDPIHTHTHINNNKHNTKQHTNNTLNDMRTKPTMFIHDNITYFNLQILLNDNENNKLSFNMITGNNNGYKRFNNTSIQLCKITHGHNLCTIIINKNVSITTLNNIELIIRTNPRTNITIKMTPSRKYTASEIIYIKIDKTLQTKTKITDIVNSLNTIIAKKQPILFWIKLFKHTDFLKSAQLKKKIRYYIAQYVWISYNIPKTQLINGLSINITLNYNPLINIDAIAHCQKLIAKQFTTNILNTRYCTFKKNDDIEAIIMNHKHFIKEYSIFELPICCCTGNFTGEHNIVMPEQATVEEKEVLRNLKTPSVQTFQKTETQIARQIYNIIIKQRLYITQPNLFYYNTLQLTINNDNNIDCYTKIIKHTITITIELFNSLLNPLLLHFNNITLTFIIINNTIIKHKVNMLNALLIIKQQLTSIKNKHTLYNTKNKYFIILHYNLLTNNINTQTIKEIEHYYTLIFTNKNNNNIKNNYTTKLTETAIKTKEKYKDFIFIPVDKNSRKAARLCPVAAHNFLTNIFICDTSHFNLLNIKDSKYDETHNTIIKTITTNLKTIKLYYNKSKDFTLPNLYFSIKLDGKRARPIGAYAKLNYKNILSRAATALLNVLKFSGITHFSLLYQQNIKAYINNINNIAVKENMFINKDTFDVKNFYTEIQKDELWNRLNFIFSFFKKTNRTDIISIPKFKTQKDCKPKPGSETSPKYMNFSLKELTKIIDFALNNAFFTIGKHILKQINGLPIGDPISGPLAFCYVAYDEHHWKIPQHIHDKHIKVFIIRCADDILRIILTKHKHDTCINEIDNLITHHLYENNLTKKNLQIIQDNNESNKYLDSDIIIYNTGKRIKLIYHNKNADILERKEQKIGRFHHKNVDMPERSKMSGPGAILIRIYDYTSLKIDMIKPIMELCTELKILSYNYNDIHSMLCSANRSRNDIIWMKIDEMAKPIMKI